MIRYGRYNSWIFLALLMIVFMSGCSQDEILPQSNGTLHLCIGQTSEVGETRATPMQLGKPLAERFNLRVQRNGDVCYDGKFVEELELRVGTYDITACYGENVEIGKDAPYYEGRVVAEIEKNASTSVTIPCRVANALVSVAFGRDEMEHDRFGQYYEKYGVIVRVGSYSLAITDEEMNGSIYFPAGSRPTLFFYGVLRESGEVVSCELESDYLPKPFAAADHAMVTLTLPESQLEVSIVKVDVETVSIEATIPVSWLPAPVATAQHRYDNAGNLVGTDVSFSNTYPGMQWRAVVTNALGEEVRRVEGSGELNSSYSSSATWPYLPSGDYNLSTYIIQGEAILEANSRAFSVGKPELWVAVGGYTSYSKYLEGDIDGANACAPYTVYQPSVLLNVSEALLSCGKYDYTFTYTYAGATEQVSVGANSYSVAALENQAASINPYRLNANATFDGVSVSGYKDFYITGLPVMFAPPTAANGWSKTSGTVSFNGGEVNLNSGEIANTNFAIPAQTKVALNCRGTLRAAAWVTNKFTITLGNDEFASQSLTGGFLSQKTSEINVDKSLTLSSQAIMMKCNSSRSYSNISSLSLKYSK